MGDLKKWRDPSNEGGGGWYPFTDYAVNCQIIIQRGEDFKVSQ